MEEKNDAWIDTEYFPYKRRIGNNIAIQRENRAVDIFDMIYAVSKDKGKQFQHGDVSIIDTSKKLRYTEGNTVYEAICHLSVRGIDIKISMFYVHAYARYYGDTSSTNQTYEMYYVSDCNKSPAYIPNDCLTEIYLSVQDMYNDWTLQKKEEAIRETIAKKKEEEERQRCLDIFTEQANKTIGGNSGILL